MRAERVQRRRRIQQLLPVLAVGSDVNLHEKVAAQSRDSNRRSQMVNRRGPQDRQPYVRKTRDPLDREATERAIEQNRFEEPEPVLGQPGKCVQAIRRGRHLERLAKVASEIRWLGQPVHHVLDAPQDLYGVRYISRHTDRALNLRLE